MHYTEFKQAEQGGHLGAKKIVKYIAIIFRFDFSFVIFFVLVQSCNGAVDYMSRLVIICAKYSVMFPFPLSAPVHRRTSYPNHHW